MKRFSITLGAALAAAALILSPVTSWARSWESVPAREASARTADVSKMKPTNSLVRMVQQRQALLHPERSVGGVSDQATFTVKGAPQARAAAPAGVIRRSYDAPRGDMNALVPIFNGRVSQSQAFYGSVDLTSGQVSRDYSGYWYSFDDNMVELMSATVCDGILYIPYFTQDMVTGEMNAYWRRVNLEDNTQLSDLDFDGDMLGFAYSLTYDPVRGKFYGIAWDALTDEFGQLVEYSMQADPDKAPIIKVLGNVGGKEGNFVTCVAYSPEDQKIHGIKDIGYMGTFDLDKHGDFTKTMEFTAEEWYVPGYAFCSQPLAYSPMDHAFVTIYINSTEETMDLVFIDSQTYETRLGPSLDNAYYVAQFFCPDQYAKDEAPCLPEITSFTLVDNALSGSYEYEVPPFYYSGLSIPETQKVHMSVCIDGAEIASGDYAPGEKVAGTFTVDENVHELTVVPSFGDKLVGPFAYRKFYAGNDTPLPPTALAVNDLTVTWQAPAAIGVNNGYVNPAQFTYNVYYGDTKVNAEPLTATTYTLEMPDSFERRNISVTTIYQGKESAQCQPVVKVFGKAVQLPVSYQPDQAESQLFQVVDGDRDGVYFTYEERNGIKGMALNTTYYQPADDWLFMPLLSFPSADGIYTLDFVLSQYYISSEYLSNLDICLGSEATVEAMTTNIYSHRHVVTGEYDKYQVTFAVPEAGDYYIGFHLTGENSKYRGGILSGFKVQQLDGTAVGRPGRGKYVVEAAPEAQLAATVDYVAPTLDMTGKALPADDKINITVTCGDATESVVGVAPGSVGTIRVDVPENGWTQVAVVASNAVGQSPSDSYPVYVGLDVPLAPTNIQGVTSADNKSLTLTWDAPTVGENGGYILSEPINYEIYTRSGVTYSLMGQTQDLTYTYTVPVNSLKAYYIGPVACNSMGQSSNSVFVLDYLGDPYPTPLDEDFPGAAFTYNPWNYNTTEGFKDFMWNATASMASMKIGDPVISQTALVCTGEGQEGYGELYVPKVITEGSKDVAFSTRFWVYPGGPDLVQLYGRRYGHEEVELLGNLAFSDPAGSPHWEDLGMILPAEYQNSPWIQLRIRVHFPGLSESEYGLIDNVKVYQQVDYDFKTYSIEGPAEPIVGDAPEYAVTVVNSGMERTKGTLKVELMGDGQCLERHIASISNLRANASYQKYLVFQMLESYRKYDKLEVVATSWCDNDEISFNNVMTLPITLKDSPLPIVDNLAAKWADDDKSQVTLSWEAPDAHYGGLESFEYYAPFSQLGNQNIGRWKNLDLDGGNPYCIDGLRWDGDEEPSAWTVIDGVDLKVMYDERLAPHSGRRYIMARSVIGVEGSSDEEQIQSSDWLISPEVVGGSKIGFWFGTLSSSYKETIDLYYSETDQDPASFKKLRAFTKSGSESWEYCDYTLPANAKYFALVYVSYHQFGAMLDDIEFTPKELDQWEIDSYSVWAYDNGDWKTYHNLGGNLQTLSFTDNTIGANDRVYYVVTTVKSPEGKKYDGPLSNPVRMSTSQVEELNGLTGVYGTKGLIVAEGHDGDQLAIYASDGKILRLANVNGDRATFAADPGVYVVKAGNKAVKVVVK